MSWATVRSLLARVSLVARLGVDPYSSVSRYGSIELFDDDLHPSLGRLGIDLAREHHDALRGLDIDRPPFDPSIGNERDWHSVGG